MHIKAKVTSAHIPSHMVRSPYYSLTKIDCKPCYTCYAFKWSHLNDHMYSACATYVKPYITTSLPAYWMHTYIYVHVHTGYYYTKLTLGTEVHPFLVSRYLNALVSSSCSFSSACICN